MCRPRLSRRVGLARAIAVLFVGVVVAATPARAGAGTPRPRAALTGAAAPLLLPNANERRAVRGRPAPEASLSNEQVILRRFEDALPTELPESLLAAPAPPADAAAGRSAPAASAPAALAGDWQGTGDESANPGNRSALITPSGLSALYLDFFNNDPGGKAVAAAWLDRLAPWKKTCERRLESSAVPVQALLAAAAASGFDVEAKGKAGETGPWLLARDLARAQGLKVGFWLDERRDPVRSTEAAAAALKGLFDRFGSWPLALVALRLGPALVEAAGPGDAEAHLPRPARLYLARISALVQLAGRSEVPAGEKSARTGDPFVVIDVPPAMTLETVAQVTGVDVLTLRTLNPALLRDRIEPAPGPTLRVPAGTAASSRASFEAAQGPADRVRIETLRLGESAEALALAKNVLPAEMKRLHGVRDLGELRGPMEVLLPLALEAGTASGVAVPGAGAGTKAAEMAEELPLVAVPARHFDLPDRTRLFYFVAEGDVIDEIAAGAEVTPAEILAWNNLDPGARLQPKMVLQLFVRPDLDRTRIALVDAKAVRAVEVGTEQFHALEVAGRGKTRLVYDAHPGDTLPKIARRFGLGAPDLARINRISWNAELGAGQRIVVYAPSAGTARGGRENAAGRTVSLPAKRRESNAPGPARVGSPRGKATPAVPVRPAKAPAKPIAGRRPHPAPRR